MTVTRDGKNWFVLLKGKRYGPYTFASLALAAESSVVGSGDGVWCVGWEDWRIARDVPGLFNQEAALEDQEEGVVSSEEEDARHDEYRDELDDSSDDAQQEVAPHASAASEPSAAKNARIVILSVLSVLVIIAAAVWTAISLGFLRVTFLF
jgi:hypothetical protein